MNTCIQSRNTVFVATTTRKKEKMHDVCKVSAMYKDYSMQGKCYVQGL